MTKSEKFLCEQSEQVRAATAMKNKPMPKKEDGGLARWLEEHLDFRPFDVE